MTAAAISFRPARPDDLPAIVRMLADDALGATREEATDPLPAAYRAAFDAIDADPNNELLVVERGDDPSAGIIGTLQLTFIPSITYRGRWRMMIEGVRVASGHRAGGIGRRMILEAIERARARGCHMVQLTSTRTRTDAIRFYEGLGFVASHTGMKLHLESASATAEPRGLRTHPR
jgi:ribosomal protein S18 acetylase RimI-like enzyme